MKRSTVYNSCTVRITCYLPVLFCSHEMFHGWSIFDIELLTKYTGYFKYTKKISSFSKARRTKLKHSLHIQTSWKRQQERAKSLHVRLDPSTQHVLTPFSTRRVLNLKSCTICRQPGRKWKRKERRRGNLADGDSCVLRLVECMGAGCIWRHWAS